MLRWGVISSVNTMYSGFPPSVEKAWLLCACAVCWLYYGSACLKKACHLLVKQLYRKLVWNCSSSVWSYPSSCCVCVSMFLAIQVCESASVCQKVADTLYLSHVKWFETFSKIDLFILIYLDRCVIKISAVARIEEAGNSEAGGWTSVLSEEGFTNIYRSIQ